MSVLYLTEQHASVRLDGDTLLVRIPERDGNPAQKMRVPLGKISQVVVFGNITLTTPAITALIEQHSEICYLTPFGKFVGRMSGDYHKHGQLRLLQHKAHHDPSAVLHVASVCVRSKLHNQRTLLLRSNRVRENEQIDEAAEQIGQLIEELDQLPNDALPAPNPARPQEDTLLGKLMGIEGAAAAAYFGAYGQLFIDKWGRSFSGRHKRPPTDPINALLSYGYTLLTTQAVACAQMVGFDEYVGYLHSTQYGKPALALDIVEMFRVPVVDSTVLTILNNRMLDYNDFEETLGAWRLTEPGRKLFLQKFEERLNTEIAHPIIKSKVTYRRCLEIQMRLLSRWLLGELKRFRGFYTR
jgi:CRISPR-associated protein Cas1